jgi:hypothetical protein
MNKPMRIARHVYLRTQQRRLRHVKGILIRNLSLPPHAYLADPLHISVFFTVHAPQNHDKVLFKSDPIQDSYNPSWESIQLASHGVGHHQSFVLRVWVENRDEEGEGQESDLVFEKKVELFDLSYLGLMVNKDGSSYPPNSVVVGMYEGLYSHPEVGGVPCAPRVVHTLTDYLPPQSLLEVPKKEVVDSYIQSALDSILRCQEELNAARRRSRFEKAKVDRYLQLEREALGKRSERERLLTRLKLFRAQLQEMEEPGKEESNQLMMVTRQVDEAETDLRQRQADLQQKRENLCSAISVFTHKKERMQRLRRNRHLRQRHMVHELATTFLIRERDDTFTICNVILPNADQLEHPTRVEQLGVALGYVAHLIHHLGKILFLPLLYPIRPQGSKSVVLDLVSEETLIDNMKEFPLFAKGSEKALFQYAVFLLNKDIAQIRQHCGYGTSKTMFKQTLPNLKFLLDRLTRDIRVMVRGNRRSTAPHTSDMMSSYVSVDTMSLASGSVMGSLQSLGPESLRSLPSLPSHSSSITTPTHTPPKHLTHSDYSFSPKSTFSDTASPSGSHHTSTIQPDSHFSPPENSSVKSLDAMVDGAKDEPDVELADLTTKQTLTGLSEPQEVDSRSCFLTVHKVQHSSDEEGGSVLRAGLSGSSSISSLPSLSMTPVVPEDFATSIESGATMQSMLTDGSNVDKAKETASVTEHSNKVVAQVGSLEETLKSAVHVTQVLLGHPPQEDIQIKPAPAISSINDAEIESTQAVLSLTGDSLMGGNKMVEKSQETTENTRENGEHENVDDSLPPQGPPLIPDSFNISPLINRKSRAENHMTDEDYNSSYHLQPRARSMAYSAFASDSGGYIKTGMATPHRVGGTQTAQSSRFLPAIREPPAGKNEDCGQSLADFIEDVNRGPQTRWKPGSNKIGNF